jgi:polyketide cyclase/dehydrase/lipid transport protein
MPDAEQSFSTDIDAPIESCVEVLLDFAHYPDWSSPITKCRVLSTDDRGRGERVEFELDMKLKTIRYVLEYAYDLPHRATWKLAEGDVSSVQGSYEFQPLDGKRSTATCSQAIDLGFWVPGPLRRMFERQALRDSVLEFKAEAERRAASRARR